MKPWILAFAHKFPFEVLAFGNNSPASLASLVLQSVHNPGLLFRG